MNLNVLIADDEYFIRQRLKKIIDWEGLGLSFIGEAENGASVIDLLNQHRVDILLLDLKMPIKSGMDVAEYVMNTGLDTKIIILTGYNDFEYAQKALKLKVEDYLVKPIQKEILAEALISCKETIINSSIKQQQLHDYKEYKKHSYLYDTITGCKDVSDLLATYEDLSIYENISMVGVFCSSNHDQCISQILGRIGNGIMFVESFKETDAISIILLAFNDKKELANVLETFKDFTTNCGDYIFISISDTFRISNQWCSSYNDVKEALYMRYFKSDKPFIHTSALLSLKPKHRPSKSIRKKLLVYLNGKDIASLDTFVDDVFIAIKQNGTRNYLSLMLTELFITLKINYPKHFTTVQCINNFVEELIDEEYSLDHLKKIVKSYVNKSINEVSPDQSTNKILINKITTFIDEHYMESDLSVADISNNFHLNPTYLGSLFKKNTHYSIVQYITYLRMEKAKELLYTKQHNITEIAELIGYSDVFYFSRKFKKAVGCSPKNYC